MALAQSSDLESIFEALRQDLIRSTRNIRSFYDGNEGRLVGLILSAYDLHNVKTILRGLSRHSSRADITNVLLPIGEMSETVLMEILRAATPREAVDILATIGHPLAQPLLVLRAERPGADLFEMELALDRWRFKEISRFIKEEPDGTSLILTDLQIEADRCNLLSVLRFVHSPVEQKLIKAYLDKNSLAALMPGVGSIPIEKLGQAYATKNMKSAVAALMDTRYMTALSEGLRAYEQSGRLSDIEKSLRRFQMRWQSGQIAKDPLGVGVVLGYLVLKTNEISNLRRIARGIQLKIGAEALRAELEFLE
jgi:V/A-type H+-transporting ATPase subunit C